MVKTFKIVFDNSYVFTYGDAKDMAQNVVMVGVKSKLSPGNKGSSWAKLNLLKTVKIYR